MPNILITGGAGYIGAHMVKLLSKKGMHPIVVDNFSRSHPNKIIGGTLVKGDIGDRALIEELFKKYKIDTVMHFAAHILVEESMKNPSKYFQNNTVGTLRMLDAMAVCGVRHFILSSTAAVFGEPSYLPIDEKHPLKPVNPYGLSKYLIEQVLPDYERAYGLKFGSLRYFNAAGADPEGELGQNHEPRTHIIPVALDVASGRRPNITVFGNDYPTKDGSCVRDYIHIEDLCAAHLLLLQYLEKGGGERFFNLGNGQGYSLFEVLDCVREVTGHSIPAIAGARRPGDPASLVADSRKARDLLGWQPARASLKTIVEDAWRWQQRGC